MPKNLDTVRGGGKGVVEATLGIRGCFEQVDLRLYGCGDLASHRKGADDLIAKLIRSLKKNAERFGRKMS